MTALSDFERPAGVQNVPKAQTQLRSPGIKRLESGSDFGTQRCTMPFSAKRFRQAILGKIRPKGGPNPDFCRVRRPKFPANPDFSVGYRPWGCRRTRIQYRPTTAEAQMLVSRIWQFIGSKEIHGVVVDHGKCWTCIPRVPVKDPHMPGFQKLTTSVPSPTSTYNCLNCLRNPDPSPARLSTTLPVCQYTRISSSSFLFKLRGLVKVAANAYLDVSTPDYDIIKNILAKPNVVCAAIKAPNARPKQKQKGAQQIRDSDDEI
ncbi:hypothetical protein SISNIDRAFT_466015 [Sistotremastrum niveocremeum HHB9708]|uniref:Uncharacterized protein n=2 Tax=Sistotremastraceae TaxID=3402574 RepID=A0A164V6I6_9AGAM|nr:hypothetical protein SISNIDRAFT_466015 [Sistotremastrum niveocremeum HHB9708]KZT36429.1 hypothetical protein SISSUDRAFT_1034836 [Sistotremastrum suecicum HHB10207 ss-3]